MSYPAANRPTSCAAWTFVSRDSHQRGDEFERCATGTSGQIVFSDAMSEFNDEVVFRRENSHRLYEFLFFVHFHANHYEEGGRTITVLP
jgi:dihydroorotase-like cyclic amidohydrolase